MAKLGDALKHPLMPHQRLIADVGGELLPSGLPAFREVIVTLMRQQGKTTLVLVFSVERCTLRDRPQRVVYTAQTGADARKKLLEDQVPLLEASPLWRGVRSVRRAQGSEGIVWRNRSRIDVLASGKSAGHGGIIDLGQIDEAFDDVDDRREQAIVPAQITKPDAQLLIVSAMGTDASVYLNRKVELGRAAALEGRTSGIAYFEWSIPLDEDVDDPRVWRRHMPALGLTIREDEVAHARLTMTDSEWRRAFGNQRTITEERAIPLVTWMAARTDRAAAAPLTYSVDVSPDRDWTALAVAGGGVAELGDYRPGTGWVVDRLVELTHRRGARVVLDGSGPAASLIADLEARGVVVVRMSPSEVTAACGLFYDDLADGKKISIRANESLDVAAAAVTKKPVGDAWRWGRRGGTDVTPIMAITLAHATSRSGPTWKPYAY